MRMDSTLNVTSEGSHGDLPATVGGVEETRERTYQTSEETTQRGPFLCYKFKKKRNSQNSFESGD